MNSSRTVIANIAKMTDSRHKKFLHALLTRLCLAKLGTALLLMTALETPFAKKREF